GRCVLAYPFVEFGRIHVRTQVRMGNLTCRRQMTGVNDLESLVLKVPDSFLDHVVGKPRRMKQRDPSHCQCAKSCDCCDRRQEYRNALRTFFETLRQCLFSLGTEKIAGCREGENDAV